MRVTILEGTPQEILEAAPDLLSTLKQNASTSTIVLATSDHAAPENNADEDEEDGPVQYVDYELAKRVLDRRDVPASVATILKVIGGAHPKFVTANDLMKALSMNTAQFRGVMGSFGRRVSHTKGYDDEKSPWFFDQDWVDELGCYEYRLPEEVYNAVRDKGII